MLLHSAKQTDQRATETSGKNSSAKIFRRRDEPLKGMEIRPRPKSTRRLLFQKYGRKEEDTRTIYSSSVEKSMVEKQKTQGFCFSTIHVFAGWACLLVGFCLGLASILLAGKPKLAHQFT